MSIAGNKNFTARFDSSHQHCLNGLRRTVNSKKTAVAAVKLCGQGLRCGNTAFRTMDVIQLRHQRNVHLQCACSQLASQKRFHSAAAFMSRRVERIDLFF